jgi:hypothetical protein
MFIPVIASGVLSAVPEPVPAKSDMLVGAYYFPGWSQAQRWYCIAASKTAQHPLLGYYREGDPDAADWHIKWALEHGVSFFAFDFYTQNGSQMLQTALDEGFLKAKYIDRFRFCLNWCNHGPATDKTVEQMELFGDLVIKKYLTHPSYLRIDGKPVVMILVGNGFVVNLGEDKAKEVFQKFEDRCKEAGLPGVNFVFCEGDIGNKGHIENAQKAGASRFCLYNYPYSGTEFTGPGKHGEATYSHLIDVGEQNWKDWREMCRSNFWPTVMPGWDRRPWTKDQDLIRTGSTPELFAESLKRARNYVNSDKVVMIEAWNEWGEGSVLEPSVEHGFAYLDQVRKVFCPNDTSHKDVDPKSLGMRMPTFDLKLPSDDHWTFDYDLMGWTSTGFTNPRNEWGAFAGTSIANDPQLLSPITYLECAKYPRFRIRMRAVGEQGGLDRAMCQLFWSTVEMQFSENTSTKFSVKLDGKWHDYDVDLSSSHFWKGTADKFRIDPVDTPNTRVEIDEIRLLSKQ